MGFQAFEHVGDKGKPFLLLPSSTLLILTSIPTDGFAKHIPIMMGFPGRQFPRAVGSG